MSAHVPQRAVLVPVPEAEPLVGALRLGHDPLAPAGVPAHVTLLAPFVDPAEIDRSTVEGHVMESDRTGRWSVRERFRLGTARSR